MPKLDLNMDKIAELYYDKGVSIRGIAKIMCCSNTTISKRMDEYGFKKRDPKTQIEEEYGKLIIKMYVKQNIGVNSIANKLGLCSDTIYNFLKKEGVFNKKSTIDELFGNEIVRLYTEEGLSTTQVAKIIRCGTTTINRILIKNDIPRHSMVGRYNPMKRPEVREKVSKQFTGRKNPWMAGDKSPSKRPEVKAKRRASVLGKKRPEISKALKGKSKPEGFGEKVSKTLKGKPKPWQVGKKNHMYGKTGENHPNWNGGSSFEPYCHLFNEEFKERVREFWGRKCGICDKSEEENGRKLSVHHVSYNKEDCCLEVVPLFIPTCNSCHSKTNNNREYWKNILTNYIMIYFNGESFIPKS